MAHSFSEVLECKVAVKDIMAGLFLDAHSCLPKALPHKIAAVEYPITAAAGCVAGGIRHIKFHREFLETFLKLQHHIEELLKEEEKLVGATIHRLGDVGKGEFEHATSEVHKVAGVVKEDVEKVANAILNVEEGAKKVGEGAVIGAKKAGEGVIIGGEKVAEGVIIGVEKVVEGMINDAKKVGEGVITSAEKVEHGVEAYVKKEGELVENIIQKEELLVKELIEEIDHEACKIKICVLEGGLFSAFFKHYKHTFEFKDCLEGQHGGSVLHWITEFETLPKTASKIFEEIKKDFLETFRGVEKYLLEHGVHGH